MHTLMCQYFQRAFSETSIQCLVFLPSSATRIHTVVSELHQEVTLRTDIILLSESPLLSNLYGFLAQLDLSVPRSLLLTVLPLRPPSPSRKQISNTLSRLAHRMYLKNLTPALGPQTHKSVKEALFSGGIYCLGCSILTEN